MKLTDERIAELWNTTVKSFIGGDISKFARAIAAEQRKIDAEICKNLVPSANGNWFAAAILKEGE